MITRDEEQRPIRADYQGENRGGKRLLVNSTSIPASITQPSSDPYAPFLIP